MALWIVTTGSSDVELKSHASWSWTNDFYPQVETINEFQECQRFSSLKPDSERGILLVPPRALGLVYGPHPDKFKDDLQFPLLDVLTSKFQSEIPKQENQNSSVRVIVLLTDQTQLFQERINDKDCPFWQDTCTLKPIFKWYFWDKLRVEPKFMTLKPGGERGIDHWNEMLTVVKGKLSSKCKWECDPVQEGTPPELLEVDREKEVVYVSHQAGTPAISSAVQFVAISQFKKEVNFLVSNQSYKGSKNIVYEPELIPSSNYWRGLQIEKAKRLIKNGQPVAALELLEKIPEIEKIVTPGGETVISRLKKIVDLLNFKADGSLNSENSENSEFDPLAALTRVRRSLDMAEIFIASENYLPGINLLAAAHETFLKAAILYILEQNNVVIDGFKVSRLVRWNSEGFCLQPKKDLIDKEIYIPPNNDDLSEALKFPVPEDKNTNSKPKKKGGSRDISGSSGDYDNWQKYLGGKEGRFTLDCVPNNNYFKLNESRLRKWLRNLKKFQEWELLKWSCTYYRTHALDLRNQNLHNLLGVERLDVIRYFLGNPNDPKIPRIDEQAKQAKTDYEDYEKRKNSLEVEKDVIEVYGKYVKAPFIEALKCFGLDDTVLQYTPLQTELEELAQALDV